jgi:hypothetical protein
VIVRLDIQPARSAVEGLAEWLVRENVAQLEAGALTAESGIGAADPRLWWWADISGMQMQGKGNLFSLVALKVAENRVRGMDSRLAVIGSDPGPWRLSDGHHIYGTVDRLKSPIRISFGLGEKQSCRLLNWLVWWNRQVLRLMPEIPLLYQSDVYYQRESEETWSDSFFLHLQGWEDCDALAATRAAELWTRGWRALEPDEPGYAEARALGLNSIEAEVVLRTRNGVLYHCIVRYKVGTTYYYDDPSARLGMFGGKRKSSQFVQTYLRSFFHG